MGDPRRDRDRNSYQRHGRFPFSVARQRRRHRFPGPRLEDVVVGRLLGSATRRSAGVGFVPSAGFRPQRLAAGRSSAGPRGSRGVQRASLEYQSATDIHRVSLVDPDRVSPGTERRDAGGSDRVGLRGVGNDPLHRAFQHSFVIPGVLETQLFIAVASVSTQCLAAVVCERSDLAAAFRSPVRGWSRLPTPSEGGSSATSTMGHSSASPR